MMITMMKSKIHFATVTQSDVYYEGSITIDRELMERAGIFPGERVQVVNLSNGERIETYTLVGEPGSGVIGMNGPAALKCKTEDQIHIISYALMQPEEAKKHHPHVLVLDENNKVRREITE